MTADAAPVRRALAALLVVGGLVHFAGLTYPRQVVFDEANFGKYVAAYCCTGQRIFDVHPPHGKLLIAGAAKLGGFDGTFSFDHIGLPYDDHVPVFALRFVPALAGTLIAPLLFLLLLELGATMPAALLGGLLAASDNAVLAESRIIVWDAVLVATTLGALVCFFAAVKRKTDGWLLVLAGALAGLAVGCKLTGLAAPGLMAVCLLAGLGGVPASIERRAWQAVVLALCGAAIYVGGWWLHWMLLTQPGPADSFYTTTGRFLDDLAAVHRSMLRENVNLAATHPDASAPWTWPWMKIAPYLWQGTGASMYLVGNPVVWWGSSVALLAIPIRAALGRFGMRMPAVANPKARYGLALLGYGIALAPLLPVKRVLFLYHYLTPLMFAVAFVVLWLDRYGWTRPGSLTAQRMSYKVVLGIAIVGFLAMSPLSYGFSAGGYDEWLAGVIRSWR